MSAACRRPNHKETSTFFIARFQSACATMEHRLPIRDRLPAGRPYQPEIYRHGGNSPTAASDLRESSSVSTASSSRAASRRISLAKGVGNCAVAPLFSGGVGSVRGGYGYQQLGPRDDSAIRSGPGLAEFSLEARVRRRPRGTSGSTVHEEEP